MRRMLSLAAAAGLAALPAAAQDVELLSTVSGHPLPAGYYKRIAEDPGFFEHAGGWRGAAGTAGLRRLVEGEVTMVVMLGMFADSPEPSVSTAAVQDLLFGNNPSGNLTEYYRQMSGGRMTLRGTVLPWVRSALTRRAAVGESLGLYSDGNTGWFLREIVARHDRTTDFGRFDNDGPDGVPNSGDDDGRVDMAVFEISEPPASCGVPTIWPHRGSLEGQGGAYTTDDVRPDGTPVVVDAYHVQSTVDCDGSPQSISVIAHETGHAFGLPDFYDMAVGLLPHQRRWVLGCFSLMAAGSWGCGDGAAFSKSETPSHMSPYEKLELGWASPLPVAPGWRREYTLQPVHAGGQVLQVPLRPAAEYLLLEYRARTGFDSHLPASGVLVYHVEEHRPLRYNCTGCARIYRQALVEADGDGALLRNAAEGGNRGVEGDIFRGRRVLDDHSTPSIRQNSGLPSNVRIEMEVLEGHARLVVSTLPVVAPARLLAPLLGSAGAPPADDDRLALDLFGNRNGRYDLGDLRVYMRNRPHAVVPAS